MITLTADRWKADDGGGWIVAEGERCPGLTVQGGVSHEWCGQGLEPCHNKKRPPAWMTKNNQECETCDVVGCTREEELDEAGVVVGIIWEVCFDCGGSGRHVIDLAVPGMVTFGEPPNVHGAGYGQVVRRVWLDGPPLPIVNRDIGTACVLGPFFETTEGRPWFALRDDASNEIVYLPSAARPGMYAQHVVEVTL